MNCIARLKREKEILKSKAQKAKTQRVQLYRTYRTGELPDIQVALHSIYSIVYYSMVKMVYTTSKSPCIACTANSQLPCTAHMLHAMMPLCWVLRPALAMSNVGVLFRLCAAMD